MPDETLTLPRARALTAPYWVSRVNIHPYDELRDTTEALAATVDALHDLRIERERRETLTPLILDHLHDRAVADTAEVRRRFVLPLKRDVFNRRPAADRVLAHPVAAEVPGLSDWAESWRRTARLEALVDAAHDDALRHERQRLTAWARDPHVQQSIAVTSADLLSAVRQRADAVETAPTKRMRKSEPTLVQYFSRATVKVSPFSRYTGIRVHERDAAVDGPGEMTVESVAALRRLYVRQAGRLLAGDPDDRAALRWKTARSLTRDATAFTVHRRLWQAPTRTMKADGFTEDSVVIPTDGTLGAVIAHLVTDAAPRSIAEVARDLADTFGWDDAPATVLVDRLIATGVLEPDLPPTSGALDDDGHTVEGRWLDFLAPFSGAVSAGLRDALRGTVEVIATFPSASGAERVGAIGVIGRAWSAVLGTSIETPLVEDAVVGRGVSASAADLDRWTADAVRLMPLLAATDDQRVLSAALETVFVDTYGDDAGDVHVREFARHAFAAFPLTQELLAGSRPAHLSAESARLLDARAAAFALLDRAAATPADEVAPSDDDLRTIADLLPARDRDATRSLSVFGQRDGDRLVVNHVYGGRARYFSRYLRQTDPAVTRGLRAYADAVTPAGDVRAQMRPTLGFNANLGPLLVDRELALDDDALPPGRTLTVDDLRVRRTATGLRLVLADGRPLDLLYTGFLVPHALPSEQMLLEMLAGTPYHGFAELTLALHARALASSAPTRTPRILAGDLVLFRRRWVVPGGFASRLPGETDTALFRRVNATRLELGIPDQVFVRPLHGQQMTPIERAVSPKPQHVDFLSRLHVVHAERRLARLGELLLVEEFTPSPSAGGVRTPRGDHAAELFFEFTHGPAGSATKGR